MAMRFDDELKVWILLVYMIILAGVCPRIEFMFCFTSSKAVTPR